MTTEPNYDNDPIGKLLGIEPVDYAKCRHANFDDYFNKCEDCGYKPEVCDNCMNPLTVEEIEHEAEYVAKLCADCKDYNKEEVK